METPKRRALGRGLEELFSTEVLDFDSLEEKIVTETPKDFVLYVILNSFTVHYFTLINAYFLCNKSFGEKRLKKKKL